MQEALRVFGNVQWFDGSETEISVFGNMISGRIQLELPEVMSEHVSFLITAQYPLPASTTDEEQPK